MMLKNVFWLLISIFLSPFILAEEPTCPADIQAALKAIEQHLKNKQWVYIYHDDCPQIQAELIEKADQIIKAANFEDYIPLMSKDTMRIIRNTFFAVKGHEFQDNSLKEHFQKYSWYKPVKEKKVTLSEAESRLVDTLKKTENALNAICESELRCPEPPPLPENVKIVGKGDKTLLQFKANSIDITPHDVGEGWSRFRYHIHPILSLNAILVCEQNFYGDSAHVWKMGLYSNEGKKMYIFDYQKEPTNFGACPFWIRQYPEILFSVNHNGCCGAIWDVLVLFNTKLKPITIMDCNEIGCRGTSLFDVLNKGDLYFFIGANGAKFSKEKIKENCNYYSYGEYSDSFILNIWLIHQNGSVELVSEAQTNCKRINETQAGYYIECEKPEPIVDIFQMTKNRETWGRIITSLRFGNKLVLFQEDSSWKHATSVIPLNRK